MNIIVFDPHPTRDNLLPLTYTRPVGDLRIGVTTIAEKWQQLIPGDYSWQTEPYLSELYPCHATPDSLYVAGNVVPDEALAHAVASLSEGEGLYHNNVLIARRGNATERRDYVGEPLVVVERLYDIFLHNGDVLRSDFKLLTAGRKSAPLSDSVRVIGDASNVFVEEGASLECCVLNTTTGPIYIGRDATVMEGSLIRGPFALCEHATINMGTKVYPDTTVGPWCKAGGELNNAVMHSYSNKAHDGFLGNAVVGSWCNLGAGCVASNLKNTYDLIRLWNYPLRRFERTKLQFCGLIMGDHSKAGINTMFNTATVIGVGCNIFGPGLPRTFIPSFTTGNASGFTDVPMEQFFDTAIRMMGRRHVELTEADRRMYLAVRDAADGL